MCLILEHGYRDTCPSFPVVFTLCRSVEISVPGHKMFNFTSRRGPPECIVVWEKGPGRRSSFVLAVHAIRGGKGEAAAQRAKLKEVNCDQKREENSTITKHTWCLSQVWCKEMSIACYDIQLNQTKESKYQTLNIILSVFTPQFPQIMKTTT